MFDWLRPDPVKRAQKRYEAKIAEAMVAQRAGDIPRFAELSAEAEELYTALQNAKARRAR